MGILNVTPDSFYAGSRIEDDAELITQAQIMLSEGADILDIGGYSSRPGATDISVEAEMERVQKAVQLIRENLPKAIISVDTFRSEVAKMALEHGAHIINDISGGMRDQKMFETVADFDAAYVMMHMKGTPQNMQSLADYEDLVGEIQHFFSDQITKAKAAGIKDIILDPGFGFSKNIQHNFSLLQRLEQFNMHGFPVLAGLSRKSMIYKTLGIDQDNSLNGTTVLNTIALQKGAAILRVHDVKEAKQAVQLVEAIQDAE